MTDHHHNQDDETYSSKIGLKCAQHEHLDCHAFVEVGFSADEVNELISRCPQSCSSSRPMMLPPTIDDERRQNARSTLTLGQRSADIGGNECPNPGWEDESCRDDPGFLADALLLPCESFQLLECDKLDAIGLNEQQVHTIINACPCSCDIPCDTWTMSPTDAPTFAPTVSPQPTTAMPTGSPTPQPSPNPTEQPTGSPTPRPSPNPTEQPTDQPTDQPTEQPTMVPTRSPTKQPSASPTTKAPTKAPSTLVPTGAPTTLRPTPRPSEAPTPFPTTARPTVSMKPTSSPTASPSLAPSISAMPTTSDYWAAATVWQENKQSFQGMIVIFGAVGAALLGLGLVALYRMKKTSRDDRDRLLQGMGYGPSGRDNNAPQKENSRMERSSRSKKGGKKGGKKGKDQRRSSSKGRVKFAEPNVRSNNARVPAAIYEHPISHQQPPVVDPMDGLVDIESDPQVGWLDNYALRHQPRKSAQAQAVVPSASDEFATLGTARSSSSTLNTKTTKGTAISKVSQKSQKSNGSGKGSIVVFEQPSKQAGVPKGDEMQEKESNNNSWLKALPFVGRDRTADTAPMEQELEMGESMEKSKAESGHAQTTSMQYVLPPTEETEECSGKKVGHIFRWKTARKTDDAEEVPRNEPVGLIERPHREKTDSHSERRRRSRSRQRMNEEASPNAAQVEATREASTVSPQQNDQTDTGIQKPAISERGAWLPMTMFGSPPRTDIEADTDRDIAVTSATTAEQQQPAWKAWVPGDIHWIKPAVAPQTDQVVDLEKGNAKPAPEASQPNYFPSLPQVEWPAWMASTAAPSEISEARQQTSIMSPTTEDGIGNDAGAFNFTKVTRGKVKFPAKWIKQSKERIEVV